MIVKLSVLHKLILEKDKQIAELERQLADARQSSKDAWENPDGIWMFLGRKTAQNFADFLTKKASKKK